MFLTYYNFVLLCVFFYMNVGDISGMVEYRHKNFNVSKILYFGPPLLYLPV